MVRNLINAFESCEEEYFVDKSEWEAIPDPLEGCQQDWIKPVRKLNGNFEMLIEGNWVKIT